MYRDGEQIRSSSEAVGSSLSSEFHQLANMVEMQLERMSANEVPRLALEQAQTKFSHGVASGRYDDDVCHRYTAQ